MLRRSMDEGLWSFNPRPREGGDVYYRRLILNALVSIHAPARGATCRAVRSAPEGSSFNPRPREGGDGRLLHYQQTDKCFNPRPREGGDPSQARASPCSACFNPRPREGGDMATTH